MKRVVFLCSFLLICSLGAGNVGQTEVYLTYGVALGQSAAGKTCPFSITGTWRVEEGTRRAKTFLYEFDPNGVIIISERTEDNLTDDIHTTRVRGDRRREVCLGQARCP